MKAEKAAGLMDIPLNGLFKSHRWFPITSCVRRRDCLCNDIWLYALFILAVV